MLVVGEFGFGLNFVGSISKSLEDFEDVGTILHGNDSELIFFINPYEECFVVVVEDSSCLWPFSLESSGLKVFISSFEKEMISNE